MLRAGVRADQPLPDLATLGPGEAWLQPYAYTASPHAFLTEDQEGNQDATVSVFTRDNDGAIRHFYSTHPGVSMDQKERGLDLLCPGYNILDLTPQGRGDWYADLSYGIRVHAAHR